MRQRTQEKLLKFSVFIITLVMIVLRFLLNEKGRVNPDSIRFMRQANVFPVIDNTTTPLGYALSIKFFTFFGLDEFWSSKLIGILAFLFMVIFAWKKNYYHKEMLLVCGLFSYLSIFSFTLSETLILPFVFLFFYISRQIIIGEYGNTKALLLLSLMLILLYNIRYSALFFMGGSIIYGFLSRKKEYGKTFMISGIIGMIFMALYKVFFIDVFNQNYVKQFLEIGVKPTSQLLWEFFTGITTTFNPFIHIANPGGGIINIAIYGIGLLNILLMGFIFTKNKLSETEKFLITIGITGILCSYFIQYFYSVNALDYRLLTPFVLGMWLVYFKKLYQIFEKWVFAVTFLSLFSGMAFTWLSKGNYLENRKLAKEFLIKENLYHKKIYFFYVEREELERKRVQIAELLSTVNSQIYLTTNSKDTLKNNVLTQYKFESKVKINKNKFQ